MQADTRTCTALRKDGSPCRGTALAGRGVCFVHAEELQGALRESRRAGGRGKSRAVRMGKLLPASLKPVLAELFTALHEVHTGDLSPGQGTAMGALASAIVRVYEAGQLEERLAALEAATELPRRTA